MHHKKLLFCILMCVIIYFIYQFTSSQKLTYLSLGDSLALGENAYGNVQYGYSDSIASYLKRNDLLAFYTKEFAKNGARVKDLENMILKNETIQIGKEQYVLKELLRRADFITLSIGANDILSDLSLKNIQPSLLEEEEIVEKIDQTMIYIDQLLKKMERYTNAKILIVGYYNPFESNVKLDRLFSYLELSYQKIATKHKASYISTLSLFKAHPEYLPNPFNIHPGSKGYSAISNQIISYLEDQLLKVLVK